MKRTLTMITSIRIASNIIAGRTIQIIILSSGIAMMVFGILRGELQMILQKAIIICLECIGLM